MSLRMQQSSDPSPTQSGTAPSQAVQNQAVQNQVAQKPVKSSALSDETARFQEDDFFGYQPTPTAQLPPPQPLLRNLSRCAIEVKEGVRDIDQLARWVTDEAYRNLLKRVVIATRGRTERGERAVRPIFTVRISRIYSPRDGVIEAVVLAYYREERVRAVVIRLEGLDGRWRASALHVM